jgi:hypothetical protein
MPSMRTLIAAGGPLRAVSKTLSLRTASRSAARQTRIRRARGASVAEVPAFRVFSGRSEVVIGATTRSTLGDETIDTGDLIVSGIDLGHLGEASPSRRLIGRRLHLAAEDTIRRCG